MTMQAKTAAIDRAHDSYSRGRYSLPQQPLEIRDSAAVVDIPRARSCDSFSRASGGKSAPARRKSLSSLYTRLNHREP